MKPTSNNLSRAHLPPEAMHSLDGGTPDVMAADPSRNHEVCGFAKTSFSHSALLDKPFSVSRCESEV